LSWLGAELSPELIFGLKTFPDDPPCTAEAGFVFPPRPGSTGKEQSTGGEVANALVCKTSIRGFNSRPVLHIRWYFVPGYFAGCLAMIIGLILL
jgi:hypothetical protein